MKPIPASGAAEEHAAPVPSRRRRAVHREAAAGDEEPERRRAAARSATSGRQVGARRDLERDLDLARERRLQLADRRVERPQPADDLLEDRQRVRRRMAGAGGRRAPRETGDGLAVALEPLLGGGRSAIRRSAWRAFSSIARRSARLGLGLGPPLLRARDSVSRSRSSWASASSPCSTASRAPARRPPPRPSAGRGSCAPFVFSS